MILQLLLTKPFNLLYSTPYPFFTWIISTLSKSVMEDLMLCTQITVLPYLIIILLSSRVEAEESLPVTVREV